MNDNFNCTSTNNILNASHNELMHFKIILEIWIYIPVCVLGITGNTISFLTLLQDTKKLPTFYLLRGLSVSDSFLLLAWLMTYTVPMVLLNLGEENLARKTSLYTWPLARTAYTLSIWMVVLVAGERYIAICRPTVSKQICTIERAKKAIFGTCVATFLFHLPSWFMYAPREIFDPCTNQTRIEDEMTDLALNTFFMLLYNQILYSIVNFIVPLLFLTFLNTKLILALQEAKKHRERMNLRRRREDESIKLMLVAIIVVFVMCQFPMVISYIWSHTSSKPSEGAQYYADITNFLTLVNSSVNFLIYCVFSTHFRHMARCLFCKNYYLPQLHANGSSTLRTRLPDQETSMLNTAV